MQTLHVVPFSPGDYVHPDETVRVTHDTTRQSMDIFLKDMDGEEGEKGRTALIIPISTLDDLMVGDKDVILILSPSPRGAEGLPERLAQIKALRPQKA